MAALRRVAEHPDEEEAMPRGRHRSGRGGIRLQAALPFVSALVARVIADAVSSHFRNR